MEITSKKLVTPDEPTDSFEPVILIFANVLELLALLFPITVIDAP